VRLDSGGLHECLVDVNFLLDMRRELDGRHDHRFEAQAGRPFSNLWLLQYFERFVIKFVDDVAWRLRRQKQTEPNRVLGVARNVARKQNREESSRTTLPFV